jgi:hypothetical protein
MAKKNKVIHQIDHTVENGDTLFDTVMLNMVMAPRRCSTLKPMTVLNLKI